jgi:hypothetical protein
VSPSRPAVIFHVLGVLLGVCSYHGWHCKLVMLVLLLLLLLLQVDLALRDMLERKAASVAASMSEEDAVGAGVAQASLDLNDTMSEGLRLRSEMQRAVQEERWVGQSARGECLGGGDVGRGGWVGRGVSSG